MRFSRNLASLHNDRNQLSLIPAPNYAPWHADRRSAQGWRPALFQQLLCHNAAFFDSFLVRPALLPYGKRGFRAAIYKIARPQPPAAALWLQESTVTFSSPSSPSSPPSYPPARVGGLLPAAAILRRRQAAVPAKSRAKVRRVGIAAIRIEGRGRNPQWIGQQVSRYRRLCDGTETMLLGKEDQTVTRGHFFHGIL